MASESEARLIIRIPVELRNRVAQVAEEQRRSMNREIQVAIEQHLAASAPPEPRSCS